MNEHTIDQASARRSDSLHDSGHESLHGSSRDSGRPTGLLVFMALFGVILPLVALAFELKTGLSRNVFFDPVPSFYHGVLIAAVPVANLALLVALARRRTLPPAWMLLSSFATGIAAFYALLYLPLTPLAPFAMRWFGLGFVMLAPLLALVSLVKGRKRLQRLTPPAPWRFLWPGIGLALAALLAADLPSTLTRIGMRMTAAQAPDTRLLGIRFLRSLGSEPVMLGLCYPRTGMSTDLPGLLLDLQAPVTPEHARTVFYRVTGTPFNSHPQPPRRTLRDWELGFDQDAGGDKVGGRADGVSLVATRMDGSLDPAAATAYLEWTMEWRNSSATNQEGRAEIALPPGAVVSRLTLWIDGEEREAAFGPRGQVRQAYQAVVRRNRDPVLVTTAGKDRVLVQLFPITGHGGQMKVRIGITAPMALTTMQSAQLQLPSFSERNFALAPGLKHAVWLESATAIKAGPGLREERMAGGAFAVRGEVAEPGPESGAAIVTAARPAAQREAWSADAVGDAAGDAADAAVKEGSGGHGERKAIVQQLQMRATVAPARVALVIDGSLSMRAVGARLPKVLAAFPSNVELGLVFAGDDAPVIFPHDRSNVDATHAYLADLSFEGGRDNSAALAAAWDWAGREAGGAIVWVHGPQVFELGALDGVLQRFQRHPGQVTLYDLAAVQGPNLVARQFDGQIVLVKVPRQAAVQDDLAALFAQWKPGSAVPVAVREPRAQAGLAPSARTSGHLARLWAADRIAALIGTGKAADREAATRLAMRYQLVTPVSGAVVLETAEQYKQAGLEPVPPGSVPTIPEPETWLMMIVALCVLAWRWRHRRLQPRAAQSSISWRAARAFEGCAA